MHSFHPKKTTLLLLLLFKTVLLFSQTSKFSFSTPEDEGFSSKGLSDIFTYVRENNINIHSLLIIRNKKIILDAYFYPFRAGLRHDLASCSLAIEKAIIKSEKGNLSLILKQTGEPVVTYPLGNGDAYKFYHDPRSGHLYTLRGYWKTFHEFEIEFNLLSKINKYRIDFKMGDKGNEVSIIEGTHHINETFPVSITNAY